MRFADRDTVSQMRSENSYDEPEGSVILGAGIGSELYQIDLEGERAVTLDADIDYHSINDIYEGNGEVYVGTGGGVFSLESGKTVALEGERVENLDIFDGNFVYSESRGEEVKDQQNNVLWSSSDAHILEISMFEGDLYIATSEGQDNRNKRLYRLNDGLVDEFDMPRKSGAGFMTSHAGELHGNFAATTWRLSAGDNLEKLYEGGQQKNGVFEYNSTLMEDRSSNGIDETFSEHDEPVVAREVSDDSLPYLNVVRTVSEESFDNIDAEVVEVDDIEVIGDWN